MGQASYTCGCGRRAVQGERRCPSCRDRAREREDERKRPIRDGRWRRMRALVLLQEPVCRICGAEPSAEVDHVVPRASGGTEARENLQGLCRGCHWRKSASEAKGRYG